MSGRALFTIVATNYIAYAATLMQSVRAQHPDLPRFIVLIGKTRLLSDVDLAAEVLPAERCGIENLDNMALWYDALELCTAIKPFVFLHLFNNGFSQATYLDPDILVMGQLYPVWDALDGHSCVLTPHHTKPLRDGGHPNDLTILQAGVYNLGFLGLCGDEDGMALARWWADQLLTGCRVDLKRGMFTDQRWMDLAPAFVTKTMILRHPGCNLAYWNLPYRTLAGGTEQGLTVDGQPLVFIHFSGIDPGDANVFSRHQNRYTAANLPPIMAELCRRYRDLLLANRWADFAGLAYAHENFADGRRIERPMRRWLLRAVDEGHLDPHRPIRIASDFFDEPAAEIHHTVPITRLMHQVWLDRRDLQAYFAIRSTTGAEAYRDWFLGGEASRNGVDPRSIAAARRPGHSSPARPCWPSLSEAAWSGPAADVATYLGEEVRFDLEEGEAVLTRGVALLWEHRPDLQKLFPLRMEAELNGFLRWCLTSGSAEGSILPEMLSGGLLKFLTEPVGDPLPRDLPGSDMPITRAFALTASYHSSRDWLPLDGVTFEDAKGRLSHALWFAFRAPRQFGWPDELGASMRAWLHQRSDISFGTFTLSRGALALWWLRPDLSAIYSFIDDGGRREYLTWLVLRGLDELGVEVADFDPVLARWLGEEPPGWEGISWFGLLVHGSRPDLRRTFDLSNPGLRHDFGRWCEDRLVREYAGTAAGRALAPVLPAAPGPIKVTLVLTGWWSARSGVGEHVRSTAASLCHCGFTDFLILDRLSGQVLQADGTPLADGTTVEAECNLVHLNADTALGDWMWMRARGLRASRTIGFWAWELDVLPSRWLSSFSYYDEIWGVSAFTAAAVGRAGLRPVRAVAQPIYLPQRFTPVSRANFGWRNDETVFLSMLDFHSYVARKNPEGVVRAFAQAFPAGSEAARLIIKTHGGEEFPDELNSLQDLTTDPRVCFLHEYFDRNHVLGLIAAADAFVSLHRAEGFGRVPAEAMLLGKPVIVTDYSGTRDFADSDTALLVPYRLAPVPPDHYVGVEGQSWAEPDLSVATVHMQWIAAHPAKARDLGARAQERIRTQLGLETAGQQVLTALNLTRDHAARSTTQ